MQREVPGDELRVLVDGHEPALPESFALLAFEDARLPSAHEVPGGRPVDEAKRRFERARPVHAHAERARGEPAVELLA
jgi:hypothetical protein